MIDNVAYKLLGQAVGLQLDTSSCFLSRLESQCFQREFSQESIGESPDVLPSSGLVSETAVSLLTSFTTHSFVFAAVLVAVTSQRPSK